MVSLFIQRRKIGNVTISRQTEMPVASSAQNKRAILKLSSNKEHKPSKPQSLTTIELRIRENHSPTMVDNIINDRTLTKKLIDGAWTLFCTVCKTVITAQKNKVREHLSTSSIPKGHQHRFKVYNEANQSYNVFTGRLTTWLQKQIVEQTRCIRGVSTINHELRADLVKTMLACGIPRNKIDQPGMKSFISRWIPDNKITASNHLDVYIDFLKQNEEESIKDIIKKCNICTVIFDGTSRVDEVFAVVLRFITNEFKIVQKLVSLRRYDSAKNHEQLANCIHNELIRYGLKPEQIVCYQKDRAAVNDAAILLLSSMYVYALNLHCISHTLCHVGEHLHSLNNIVKELLSLIKSMLNQNSGCNKASTRWKSVFGDSWKNPGNTRWWSTYETIMFINLNWDKFLAFVNLIEDDWDVLDNYDNNFELVKLSGKRLSKIRSLLNTESQKAYMKLELNVISILAKPLIEGTYILEGDSVTSFVTYDVLYNCYIHLQRHCDIKITSWKSIPKDLKDAIKESIGKMLSIYDGDDNHGYKKQLRLEHVERVKSIGDRALKYFKKTIYDFDEADKKSKLYDDIQVYKICKLFDPIALRSELDKPNWRMVQNMMKEVWDSDIRKKKKAPLFSQEDLQLMGDEWDRYIRKVNQIQPNEKDYDPTYRMQIAVQFWRDANTSMLIQLRKFAMYCALMPASSGAAERVFSILKNSLSMVQMHSTYDDSTELTVMTQYNGYNGND